MSTSYLRRVLAGEFATPDEWNEHLVAFHEKYENATCGPMSLMRNDRGETSYQVLARRAREIAPSARAILDVGCGEGFLLRKLKREFSGQDVELVGIDLCDAEIARATSMLDGATFLCGDACLADLGDARFDLVTLHLVLTIAARPKVLLSQLRKAMRPGATLAILAEALPMHPTAGAIFAAGMEALKKIHRSYVPSIPDQLNVTDEAVLRALLGQCGFAGDITVEPVTVSGRFTRADFWGFVQRIYPFGLLDPAASDRVHNAVSKEVTQRLDADGKFDVTFRLQLILAGSSAGGA